MCGENHERAINSSDDYCPQNRPVFDNRSQTPYRGNSHVNYYSRKYWRYGLSGSPASGRYGNRRGFGSNNRGRINEWSCKNYFNTFKKQRRIQERDANWTSITYNVAGTSKSETLFLMDIEEESIHPESFNLDEAKETENTPEIFGHEQQTTDVPKQVEETMEIGSNNNNQCVSSILYNMRTDTESQQYIQNKGVNEAEVKERLPTQVADILSCYGNDVITPEDIKNPLSDNKFEGKTTKVEDKSNINDMTDKEIFALGKKLQEVIRDTSPSSMSRLLPNTLPNKKEISSNEVVIPSNNDGMVTNINDLPRKTYSEITTSEVQNQDATEDSSEDELFQKMYKRIKRRSCFKERAPLNECTNKEVKIVMKKLSDTTLMYWEAKRDHNRNISSDVCKIKPKAESNGPKNEKLPRCEKQRRESVKDKYKLVPSFAVKEGVHSKAKKVEKNPSLERQTESRNIDVSELLDQALENSESWKTSKTKNTAGVLSTKPQRGKRAETQSNSLPSFPVKIKIKQSEILQRLHSECKRKPSDTKCKPTESNKNMRECESQNSDLISGKRKSSETENLPRLENKVGVTNLKLCEKKSKEKKLDEAINKKKKRRHSKEFAKNVQNEHTRMPKNATTIAKESCAKGKAVDKKTTSTEKQLNECTTLNNMQKLQGDYKSVEEDSHKMLIAKKKHAEHFAENYLHKKIRKSCKFAPVTGIVPAPHHFNYLLEDLETFQKLEDDVVRIEIVASGIASASQIPAETSTQTKEIDRSETKKNVREDTAKEVTPSAIEKVDDIERPSSVVSLSSTVDLDNEEVVEQQILCSDDCAPATESRVIAMLDNFLTDMPDLNAFCFDESFSATKDVGSSTGENCEEVVSSQREENSKKVAPSNVEYRQAVDAHLEKNQEDDLAFSIVEYLQDIAASLNLEYEKDGAQSIKEFHQEGKSGESREEVASIARTTQQETDEITRENQQTVAINAEYQQEVPIATGENQRDVAASSGGNQQEVAAITWDKQPIVVALNSEHQQVVAPATCENQRAVALLSEVKQQVTTSLAVKSVEQVPSFIEECPQENTVTIQQNIIIFPPPVQPETLPDTNKSQSTIVSPVSDTPAKVNWLILFIQTYNPPVINHVVDKDLVRRMCACYKAFLKIEMIYNRQLFENASGIPKGIRTTALDYRLHLTQHSNKFERLLLKSSSEDTLEEFLQMIWRSCRRENMCVYICCLIRLLQDVKSCSPWIIYLLDRLSILFYINPQAFINMMDIKLKEVDATSRETLLHHLTVRCKQVYAEKVKFGTSDEHKDHILRSFLFRDDTNVRECNMEFLMNFKTKKVQSIDAIMQDWLNWNSTDPKIAVKCSATLTGVMSVKPSIAKERLPQDNVPFRCVPANQSPAQPIKSAKPHYQSQRIYQQIQPKPSTTSQFPKMPNCQLRSPTGLNTQYQQQPLPPHLLQPMPLSNSQYHEQPHGTNTANVSAPPVQYPCQSMTALNLQYQQQPNDTYVGNTSAPSVPLSVQPMTAVKSQHQQRQKSTNTGNASSRKDQQPMLNSRLHYHDSGVSQSAPQYMSYSYSSTRGHVSLSHTYGYQQQSPYSTVPQYQQPVGFNAAALTNMPQTSKAEVQAYMQRQPTVNYATQRVPCQNQAIYNVPSQNVTQICSTTGTYRPPPLLPQLPPISQTPANGAYIPQILQRHSNHRSDSSGTDFTVKTQQTQMAYAPQHAVSLSSTGQTGAGRVPVQCPRNGPSSSVTTVEFPSRSPLELLTQLEQTILPGTQREPRPRANSSSKHVVGQIALQAFRDCSNASPLSSSTSRRNSAENLDLVKFHYTQLIELVSKIQRDGGTIPKEVQGMIAGNLSSVHFTDVEMQALKAVVAKQLAIANEIIVIKDEEDYKEEVLDCDQAVLSNPGYEDPVDNELTEEEHLQPHDLYTCICGAIADKKCACNMAIYCSEECRLMHLHEHLPTCLLSKSS